MIAKDYIVGLTDGEGCFYVWVRPEEVPRSKWRPVRVHFYIKMRQDEKLLLEEIRKVFGCGCVIFQREKRKNHSHCYRYEVNNYQDLKNVIIPFFEKHPLQSQKRKNFEIFKQIVQMINQNDHLSDEGLKIIRQLKSQMNHGGRRVREIRSHGGNAKQT